MEMTGPLEDFPEERRCSFFSWSPLGAVHKASMRRASFLKRLGRPRQRKVGHVLDNYLESWPANSHAKAKRNKSFKSHGLIRRACQTNTFSSRGGVHKKSPFHKSLGSKSVPHHDEGHEKGQKRKSRPAVQGRAAQQEALHAQEGWQR